MVMLFDHRHPVWLERYGRHERENGAQTYSKDIVKYQIPVWEDVLTSELDEDEIVIATCDKLNSDYDLPANPYLLVHYLHKFPEQPKNWISDLIRTIPCEPRYLVLVTAYLPFYLWLKRHGIRALWVPMTVGSLPVEPLSKQQNRRDGVVYYGNVRDGGGKYKQRTLNDLTMAARREKKKLTIVSELPQTVALKQVREYQYGIGVGRCAQEMSALGLKVMIAGKYFGGLITNKEERKAQLATNLNGQVVTFSRDMRMCFESFDESISCHIPAETGAGGLRQSINGLVTQIKEDDR